MLERLVQNYRELEEITTKTDTRDILSHATKQSESYEDYFLVDIDAHVTETQFWPEIIGLIDNEVIRQWGEAQLERGGNTALLNTRARHDLPVPARPHSAPGRAAGAGGETRRAPLHRAGAPLHGRDGARLSDRVPDADAHARHASAGRRRGRTLGRL